MSNTENGNVMAECLIALFCLMVMSSTVALLCRLQVSSQDLREMEDTFMLKQDWESKGRCRIYCPKDDPIVDITY